MGAYYDVYDQDEGLWACWSKKRGYLCEWMTRERYTRWYHINLGCLGKTVPGPRTIFRSQADEEEAQRDQKNHRL